MSKDFKQELRRPLFLMLTLAGCSGPTDSLENLPRRSVQGSVTLNGQPLTTGKIQFQPVAGTPGATTTAVGEIEGGKYSIARELGPVPGSYKIVISSIPPVKLDPGQPPGPLPKPESEKVPPQFNVKSSLTRDVTDESVVTLDFDLKSP